MNIATAELIQAFSSAFKNRKMPEGRLIRSNVNLSFHQEAMRVDAYLREKQDVVDHYNSAMVAFNYMTPMTSLWMLPKYMNFLLRHFEDDDFMIALVIGAIASGMPDGSYQAQEKLGLDMRNLANSGEVRVVNEFCRWIQKNTYEIGLDALLDNAVLLWS